MQCKKCKKECMESELTNGYCYDCYQKYKNDITELKNIENPVATKVKTASSVIKIIGYIGTVIILLALVFAYGFLTGIIGGILEAFAIFIITTLLDGFAEIIQLLQNIKDK